MHHDKLLFVVDIFLQINKQTFQFKTFTKTTNYCWSFLSADQCIRTYFLVSINIIQPVQYCSSKSKNNKTRKQRIVRICPKPYQIRRPTWLNRTRFFSGLKRKCFLDLWRFPWNGHLISRLTLTLLKDFLSLRFNDDSREIAVVIARADSRV